MPNKNAIEIRFIERSLDPVLIKNMDENDRLLVNRVRLNAKLVECELKNITDTSVVEIVLAINIMKDKEKQSHKMQMGAEMKVKDIKRLFPNFEKMPRNSFAYTGK